MKTHSLIFCYCQYFCVLHNDEVLQCFMKHCSWVRNLLITEIESSGLRFMRISSFLIHTVINIYSQFFRSESRRRLYSIKLLINVLLQGSHTVFYDCDCNPVQGRNFTQAHKSWLDRHTNHDRQQHIFLIRKSWDFDAVLNDFQSSETGNNSNEANISSMFILFLYI